MESITFTPLEKWLITVTVMLVAIIEVLDITIVNVSLDQMMGAFSANSQEITWVLTAYLVSSAIFMPLTGLLVRHLGCKRLLLINIVGFLIASMLCGASTTLSEIVVFRILQGVFGASLVPIAQYVMRFTFTQAEQGKAMAIWGIGIMVAPVLGPTLGGYITENLNWRWVFYINAPVCVLAFFMALSFIKETPREHQKIDWLGLMWMTIAIGALQIILDQGNNHDWFSSNLIIGLTIVCVLGFIIFLYRGWYKTDHIINLHLFKERHFAISTLILSLYCMGFMGSAMMQPLMLQILYNYPSDVAGNAMAPRGIASAVMMIFAVPLGKFFSSRALMLAGILLTCYGTYMMTLFNLNDDLFALIMPGIIQGLGLGLVMVPISSTAFNYLKPSEISEAAGQFSFGRSLGVSIGISILSTVLSMATQQHWNQLAGYINLANPNFLHWAAAQNLDPHDIHTIKMAANLLGQQSTMIAFLDLYWVSLIMLLLTIPLVFLLKKPIPTSNSSGVH